MVPNCQGCLEELNMAYYEQEVNGLHLATCVDIPSTENVCGKGHFFIMMVNDKGKVIIS